MARGRGYRARVRQAFRLREGDTGSTLSHLEGGLSGRRYAADELMGLDPVDQRPLLARYDLDRAARTMRRESIAARRSGRLWRWQQLLPAHHWEDLPYLGVVVSPVQAARSLR